MSDKGKYTAEQATIDKEKETAFRNFVAPWVFTTAAINLVFLIYQKATKEDGLELSDALSLLAFDIASAVAGQIIYSPKGFVNNTKALGQSIFSLWNKGKEGAAEKQVETTLNKSE